MREDEINENIRKNLLANAKAKRMTTERPRHERSETPRAVSCPDEGNLNHDVTTCSKRHFANAPRPPEGTLDDTVRIGWISDAADKKLKLFPKLVAALELSHYDHAGKCTFLATKDCKICALLQEARGER